MKQARFNGCSASIDKFNTCFMHFQEGRHEREVAVKRSIEDGFLCREVRCWLTNIETIWQGQASLYSKKTAGPQALQNFSLEKGTFDFSAIQVTLQLIQK